MIWRVIPVAILLALGVTGGGASAQPACPGTEYTGPTTGTVVILPKGTPVAEHHQVQLTFTGPNQGEVVPGSASFELDGPGGHVTLPGGEEGATKWTVPAAGHYQISAHWTQYRCCADASAPTFAAGSAPAVGFDAIKEQRPGIAHNVFRFARRVTHHLGVTRTIPARVTLRAGPDCPSTFTAMSEPLVTTLYYRRGTRAPTHASPHVVGRFPGGCYGLGGSAGAHRGSGFRAAASGRLASIEVVEPTAVRVLIEVTSGGALVGTIHAAFRPSRTGESLVVR